MLEMPEEIADRRQIMSLEVEGSLTEKTLISANTLLLQNDSRR